MSLLAEELGPTISCQELLDLIVSAKNECHVVQGYSPNQWAFGESRDRLESYLQTSDRLAVQSERVNNETFEAQSHRRNEAKVIFQRSDARRRVQRALLYRSRKEQSFEIGQLVYFFRRGRGHGSRYESRCFGPAQVV